MRPATVCGADRMLLCRCPVSIRNRSPPRHSLRTLMSAGIGTISMTWFNLPLVAILCFSPQTAHRPLTILGGPTTLFRACPMLDLAYAIVVIRWNQYRMVYRYELTFASPELLLIFVLRLPTLPLMDPLEHFRTSMNRLPKQRLTKICAPRSPNTSSATSSNLDLKSQWS
jgi:hypothetical protein